MYLSLFCFSMLNLVLADNLFQVFVSWELVGICSYLLIGFYFERQSAANAANKAFITNRVGDAGFIIGLLILWTYVGTFNFEEIFAQIRSPVRDAQGGLVLGGQFVRGSLSGNVDAPAPERCTCTAPDDGAGTSALLFPREPSADFHGVGPARRGSDQLGPGGTVEVHADPEARQFGVMPYWMLVAGRPGHLPRLRRQVGPVPAAGLAARRDGRPDAGQRPHPRRHDGGGRRLPGGRVYPLFTPEALLVIAYTGGITLFVAATIAVVMTDIKKVLAYSTVSQLGYMMLALGVGGWVAGLFHLMTHAFFKALLFLCSGSRHLRLPPRAGHAQDGRPVPEDEDHRPDHAGRRAGHLRHAALQRLVQQGRHPRPGVRLRLRPSASHVLLFLLPLVTAGITTFYMFRMWFLTFTGKPRDAPRLRTRPRIAAG